MVSRLRSTALLLALVSPAALLLLTPHARSTVQASSKSDREAGAALFHEKGCEHCHGANLAGTDKGPNLTGVGRHLKSAQIELQIHDGGNGMPPFGDVLAPDEVKDLVEFLRTQRSKVRPPAPAARPPAANGPA